MPSTPKPIDRWLALITAVMALLTYLFAKTPVAVVVCVVVMFVLLVHPLWNFWWIEKKTWRRITALTLTAFLLVLVAIAAWPEPQPVSSSPTASEPISVSENNPRLSELTRKVASAAGTLRDWPWAWIVFSTLVGAGLAAFFTARRLNRRSCPYEWVHAKARDDKTNIKERVRIPGIIYKPYFEAKPPYIEFGFSVFNNSLYDLVIDNSLKGSIRFGEGHTEFEYSPPKVMFSNPLRCASRNDTFFDVRQAVTEQEVKIFRESPNINFRFDTLKITFRGVESSQIDATVLDTSNCYLDAKERMWRAWDHLEFVFGWSEEQWAAISSGTIQSAKEIKKLEAENATLKTKLQTKAVAETKQPNLVFLRVEDVLVYYDEYYNKVRKWESKPRTSEWRRDHPAFTIIVAWYRNQPQEGTPPSTIGNLSGELTYKIDGDSFVIPRGLWFPENRTTIDIAYNDVGGIILAELYKSAVIYGRDGFKKDDTIELGKDSVTVSVRLFSGADGSSVEGGTFKIEYAKDDKNNFQYDVTKID